MADNMITTESNGLNDPMTVRINEIEFQSRTGSNTSQHTMWLIETLRTAMSDRISLLRGIAKSAELLGNALDRLDIPEMLLDDITDDFAYDETEDLR